MGDTRPDGGPQHSTSNGHLCTSTLVIRQVETVMSTQYENDAGQLDVNEASLDLNKATLSLWST